ncbi:hypothetical protein A3709_16790 [Halioglobus sp. HI00S01]|uniref:DUF6680 family protein n=1 Tax=Halioglobus sp. HI00S01 TaxID=1822214 RepID=UPI0007C22537|nr:DUF6680 family protein [Halioglobus sp. HI00S01]KZX59199.1 hypothetical protein A3709_16790 [Halioglobus sp. HI00S01]
MELLTLIAILTGPIIAVQVSQLLERRRERRGGKEWVFKTLMRTRATTLSQQHVEALNMIDVEFYGSGKKDRHVVSAWRLYLDSLNDFNTAEAVIIAKRKDLFIDLLSAMATALGYEFDREHIKNTTYIPQHHVDVETEQQQIRKGFLGVLKGDISVPMYVTNLPKDGR